jgi:uncharacterized repeat protein (TIGR02543 family)
MDSDKTITATFTQIPTYTLVINTSGNGIVTVDPAQSSYSEGEQVMLTATADPGWEFSGWSGDLTGSTNPATVTMDGDKTVMATFTASSSGPIYEEDFESYSIGSSPTDWLDTAANNSMSADDSLFQVFEVNGNNVFGTTSAQTNIHSHYMGTGSDTLSDYQYSGRMMMTDSQGGIGVTLLSQYPQQDAYYRLRRYFGNSFHLSPHPNGKQLSGGTTDTGVVPVANVWYWFKIEVEDTGTRTEIRAKVWAEGETEPGNWQIDAYDESGTRLTAGRFGIWSFNTGSKYWDDLSVQ